MKYTLHPEGCRLQPRHASHEACELKSYEDTADIEVISHASHEACELKYDYRLIEGIFNGHASHEACELKSQNVANNSTTISVTPRMRRVS